MTSKSSALTEADRQWIKDQVARAPRFTDEQRDKLAELLRPVRKAGGGVRPTTGVTS